MAINNPNHSRYLDRAVREAGHKLVHHSNTDTWIADDETAVQTIIDTYDPVPYAKEAKIALLRLETLRLANLIYDPDGDEEEVFTSINWLKIVLDINTSYTSSGSPSARWQDLGQTISAQQSAVTAINALTSVATVEAYDVTSDPGWP